MKYKGASGKPTWSARRGSLAAKEANTLDRLVKVGLASRWMPLRSVDDAIRSAGL